MITYGDIKPSPTASSVSGASTTSSSLQSSNLSSDLEQPKTPENLGLKFQFLIPRVDQPQQKDFLQEVVYRDHFDVCWTRHKPSYCYATHLVNPSNPLWVSAYLTGLIQDRWLMSATGSSLTSLLKLGAALVASL